MDIDATGVGVSLVVDGETYAHRITFEGPSETA